MLTNMTNKSSWLTFLILVLVFISLQLSVFIHAFKFTDSLHYFYSSKLVAEGLTPYKDFLFTHPPLQLYILALPTTLFGYNHMMLRMVPLIGIVILSLFLFKLVKNNFGNVEALLAVLFFLFTDYTLINSTYSLGSLISLMFITIGIYFLLEKKYFISGIFLGLASITRLLALPAFFIILLFCALKVSKGSISINYHKPIKFLLGFVAVFLPVHLYFIISSGNFIDFVYLFQAGREPMSMSLKFFQFWVIFKSNKIIFLLPLFLVYFAYSRKLMIFLWFTLGYVVSYLISKTVFHWYILMIFPCLAIVAGVGLANLTRKITILTKKKHIPYILLFIFLGLVALSTTKFAYGTYFSNQEPNKYLEDIMEISTYIKSNSDYNEQIFGGGTQTSLIALESDRRIALDYAVTQTEIMVFNKKEYSYKSFLDGFMTLLDDNKVKFIIFPNISDSARYTFYEKETSYHDLIKKNCIKKINLTTSNFILLKCY